jgi:hypothetical protein|tara:strand:- start:96 stop:314 length:219 start_codon:yes stop_codon:yes gene_type:complete
VSKDQNKTIELLVQLTGIGWFIAISISGLALLGVWIDGLINIKPVGVISGIILGVILAGFGSFKMIKRIMND